jgi:DNA-binding beta-propeller fold protein YncE
VCAHHSSASRGFLARELAVFWAALVLAVGSSVRPARAAPFAYVTNEFSRTDKNTVVSTVPVGEDPSGVAVAPDGKRAFVANEGSNNVSVVATVEVPAFNFSLPQRYPGRFAFQLRPQFMS